ncbi:MAG TPA: GlsB/YeaQ/YmgE family stress response membrane protein [Deltaproteobacteria bacterium]|nr:GlsB/YeaQ/YmgE family stress response membrane protein [Deltaproteobacteria bacterium]
MHWFWFILIGLVAGWLAGLIMRGHGFGVVGNIIIGICGALIGGFLFRTLGVVAYGTIGSLVTALLGAIILIFLIRLFKRV